MVTAALKRANPPESLRKKLEEMIGYSGDEKEWPTYIQVVTGIDALDMKKKEKGTSVGPMQRLEAPTITKRSQAR